MKRTAILICAALMLGILAGCSGSQNPSAADNTTQVATVNNDVSEKGEPISAPDITVDSLMATPAAPDTMFTYSNAAEEGTVSPDSYKGSESVLVIPDEMGGKRVSCLTQYLFANNTNLVAVKVPDSATELEEMVFSNASALKIIAMGSSLKSIGKSCFLSCVNLETVVLNNGLSSIGRLAFSGCSSLKSIYIPESVTTIAANAFFNVGEGFVIEGKAGSYAETYASENDITFKAK